MSTWPAGQNTVQPSICQTHLTIKPLSSCTVYQQALEPVFWGTCLEEHRQPRCSPCWRNSKLRLWLSAQTPGGPPSVIPWNLWGNTVPLQRKAEQWECVPPVPAGLKSWLCWGPWAALASLCFSFPICRMEVMIIVGLLGCSGAHVNENMLKT